MNLLAEKGVDCDKKSGNGGRLVVQDIHVGAE